MYVKFINWSDLLIFCILTAEIFIRLRIYNLDENAKAPSFSTQMGNKKKV